MKKLLCIICFCLLTISATYANDNCYNVSDVAQTIMKARQENIPLKSMLELLDRVDDSKYEGQQAKKYIKDIIIDAYSRPGFSAESNKQRAIVDFSNEYMIKCLKGE
jgi:hypothetical protein